MIITYSSTIMSFLLITTIIICAHNLLSISVKSELYNIKNTSKVLSLCNRVNAIRLCSFFQITIKNYINNFLTSYIKFNNKADNSANHFLELINLFGKTFLLNKSFS
jgi:hypothetical protein